jgi:hypothetical protein
MYLLIFSMNKLLYVALLFSSSSFSQRTINYSSTESKRQSCGSITVTASGGSSPYLYEITAVPTTKGQQVPNCL